MTNIHDTEAALSLLKLFNWDMEKAVEGYSLGNVESLSISSSGSDFVVIDRNSLSNDELIDGFVSFKKLQSMKLVACAGLLLSIHVFWIVYTDLRVNCLIDRIITISYVQKNH